MKMFGEREREKEGGGDRGRKRATSVTGFGSARNVWRCWWVGGRVKPGEVWWTGSGEVKNVAARGRGVGRRRREGEEWVVWDGGGGEGRGKGGGKEEWKEK